MIIQITFEKVSKNSLNIRIWTKHENAYKTFFDMNIDSFILRDILNKYSFSLILNRITQYIISNAIQTIIKDTEEE